MGFFDIFGDRGSPGHNKQELSLNGQFKLSYRIALELRLIFAWIAVFHFYILFF
jgi:hypothetical protein